MLTSRVRRTALVLIVGFFLAAACGGSSSPKPAAQPTNAGNQTDQPTDSSDGSESDSGSDNGGAGGADVPIVDATYQQGSGHIEISGGASKSAEFTKAGGYTTSGATFVTFTDAESKNALTVTLSTTDATGITATVGGIATAGEFGKNCQINVTKNEASEFAGKVTCTDVDGIDGATAYSHLNLTATFSAKP